MEKRLDKIVENNKDKAIVYLMLHDSFLNVIGDTIRFNKEKDIPTFVKKLCTTITANLDDDDYMSITRGISARNEFHKVMLDRRKFDKDSNIIFALIALYMRKPEVYAKLGLLPVLEFNADGVGAFAYRMIKEAETFINSGNTSIKMLIGPEIDVEVYTPVINGTSNEKELSRLLKELRTNLANAMLDLLLGTQTAISDRVIKDLNNQIAGNKKSEKVKTAELRKFKDENKKLTYKVEALEKKVAELSVDVVEVEEVYTYEKEYQEAQEEIFMLEQKYSRATERLRYLEASMKDSSEVEEIIELQKDIEKEDDGDIDISNLKVVVVGDDQRLQLDSFYKVLDVYRRPNGIGLCDSADVVVIMTGFLKHTTFFKTRDYCKMHGIKFRYCSTTSNNMNVVEVAVKHEVVESLK